MIVKSKRVRARGQALRCTLQHLMNGEDNDAVILVAGTVADLEDARADALRFGRQYALRHWIISPGQRISHDQLREFVDRLALEFGFDPARAVIWEHTKARATEDGCDQHFHVCVGEVDPVTGGVMSSSHDWARHEKLARSAEFAWGHAIVPGRHSAAVAAALEREGGADAVASLREIASPDHRQSFDEKSHQRLKRSGYDLPRLRELISEALSAATDRTDFEARLANIGLRLRSGDKADTLIIEAIDDDTLVGSLARLTRLRKSALLERLKFNAEYSSKNQADHSPSHLPAGAEVGVTDRAAVETGKRQQRTRTAGPYGYDGRPVAGDGDRHRSGPGSIGKHRVASGRSAGGQSDQVGHAKLTFAVGCHRHQNTLLDLLGVARRAALPPLERVTSDLDDLVENERRAYHPVNLPEPTSLLAARREVEKAATQVRSLELRASDIEQQLINHQPPSIWRRLWQPSVDHGQVAALGTQLDRVQQKILSARGNHVSAMHALKAEESRFRLACARQETTQSARRTQADANLAVAQAARKFLAVNPHAARWGTPNLIRVIASLQKARTEWQTSRDLDAPNDWSLVPIVDLWGKPYLPP